jgi:hemerythrin-like domain-containing protein
MLTRIPVKIKWREGVQGRRRLAGELNARLRAGKRTLCPRFDEKVIKLEQLTNQKDRPVEGVSTLDRPLDHLVACHRRIEDRLETLERVAAHFESKRAEAIEALGACLKFFDSSGALHTADEEQSVFPRMRSGLSGAEVEFLAHLEEQHREADGLFAEIKSMARELEAGAEAGLTVRFRGVVARLAELYRAHMAAEDQTLIGLGRRVLAEDELRAISREMKERREIAG